MGTRLHLSVLGTALLVSSVAIAIGLGGAASAATKSYPLPASAGCKPHYVDKHSVCVYQKPVPVTISIGVNYGSPALPVLVDQQLGYYKQWGITANVTNYPSLGLVPAAVTGGSVQLGEGSEPSLISASARGVDLVTPVNLSYGTGTSDTGPQLMVMKSSGITSVSQLAGSNHLIVATSLGANLDIATRDAFREAGITGSQMPTFVTAPTTTIVAELVSGQAQAAELGTPYVQEAEAAGAVSILNPFSVQKGLEGRTLFMGLASYVQANPVAMTELRNATAEADTWIASHPKGAKNILMNWTGLSQQVMNLLIVPSYTAQPSAAELSAWVVVMKETGYLATSAVIKPKSLVYFG